MPALFPVAGQSLIEYQVRVARAAGAAHIIVLVDHMPAALVAAFDRLRADGIDIDIARDARDAADRIHPDEQLLVMANGAVASPTLVADFVAPNRPALLTVPDTVDYGHCERIDARSRWSGLALVEGALLRTTAAMLGDWTLGPTLLRAAVQSGTEQRLLSADDQAALIGNEAAAARFTHQLAQAPGPRSAGWFEDWLVRPLTARATPTLFARRVPLDLIVTLPLVLLGSAILLVLLGWFTFGFLIALLAIIPAGIAFTMANIAARAAPLLDWYDRAKHPALGLMLLVTGWGLSSAGTQWGALIAAGWAASNLLLLERDRAPWHANGDMAALVMLLTCAVGQPLIGIAVLVAHGLLTQISLRQMK